MTVLLLLVVLAQSRPVPTNGPCHDAEATYARAWQEEMDCLRGWDPTAEPRFPRGCAVKRDLCLRFEADLRTCEAERHVLRRDWYTCTK